MALKATIFKAELQISDLDRHYYATHNLTVARHPSETDERMMLRLAAFALFADPELEFTRGLSSDDEPDLWQKTAGGDIAHWIELGQPDERRIRQACGRAQRVTVLCYGGRSADIWWQGIGAQLGRHSNLSVLQVAAEESSPLLALVDRNMRLQCSIDGGSLWLSDGDKSAELQPQPLLERR